MLDLKKMKKNAIFKKISKSCVKLIYQYYLTDHISSKGWISYHVPCNRRVDMLHSWIVANVHELHINLLLERFYVISI